MTILLSPFADGPRLRWIALSRRVTRLTVSSAVPGSTRSRNVVVERLTKRGGMVFRQVDLVRTAIQSETHCFVRVTPVQIVHQLSD